MGFQPKAEWMTPAGFGIGALAAISGGWTSERVEIDALVGCVVLALAGAGR